MKRWLTMLVVVAVGAVVGLTRAPSTVHAAALPDVVVVVKQYGAALRTAPDSDAPISYTASCGDFLTVVGARDGWYEVYAHATYLWVGGARVADAAAPPSYDCSAAFTFQIGDEVQTLVPSGCLSLRYTPSRQAPYDYCVENGHHYFIANGPIEVDGEDWFEVWSASTDSGWVLAEYLYPAY
jgi:hypothetical protein